MVGNHSRVGMNLYLPLLDVHLRLIVSQFPCLRLSLSDVPIPENPFIGVLAVDRCKLVVVDSCDLVPGAQETQS